MQRDIVKLKTVLQTVSALLLDDALKPATPLTNGAINENLLIFDKVKAYNKMPSFWATVM